MAGARPYFYDMDAVRAVLMLLGVPYHAARIYAGTRDFAVESPVSSPVLDALSGFIHSFRMEAFFIVAGYFAAMVLWRSATGAFLASRTVRIGVPLLVCTLLFAPAGAALILAGTRHGGAVGVDEVAAMLSQPGSWWVMHLWFLQVVLVQTALLAGAAHLVRRWPPAAGAAARLSAALAGLTQRRFVFGGVLLGALMTAVWVVPNVAAKLGVDLHPLAPAFDLRLVIRFLPMFGFGVALWALPALRQWFSKPEPWSLPIALAASLLFMAGEHAVPLSGALAAIGAGFAGLFWAQVMLSFAARHLTRPNAVVTWLAQASYTVYLFHFPIVLALGLWFLGVDLPPLLEFAIITSVTLAICFAIFAVIRRSRLLGFLFNGKPLRGATAAP